MYYIAIPVYYVMLVVYYKLLKYVVEKKKTRKFKKIEVRVFLLLFN
jgi:hypothetical protein